MYDDEYYDDFVDAWEEHVAYIEGADYDDGALAEAKAIAMYEEEMAAVEYIIGLDKRLKEAKGDEWFAVAAEILQMMDEYPDLVQGEG